MNARTVWLLPLMVAGCLDPNEVAQVDLKDGGVSMSVADWFPAPEFPAMAGDEIHPPVTKLGPPPSHNGAKPIDCVRLSASTTITANGIPGMMLEAGGYDAAADFENNCIEP